MAGQYTTISQAEFDAVVKPLGFVAIVPQDLPNIKEIVYAKALRKGLGIRIFSTIAYGQAREKGQDAIRVIMVTKNIRGEIRGAGVEGGKVLRIAPSKSNPEGWRRSLKDQIFRLENSKPPACPKCSYPMTIRHGKNGEFWGCVNWAKEDGCNGTMQIGS